MDFLPSAAFPIGRSAGRRTQLQRPADDEGAPLRRDSSGSPERFITVIRVVFADAPPSRGKPPRAPASTASSAEDTPPHNPPTNPHTPLYFYRGGHRPPPLIISGNRLCARNKLVHLSVEMIEQKGKKKGGERPTPSAAHSSKLFTRGAKSAAAAG